MENYSEKKFVSIEFHVQETGLECSRVEIIPDAGHHIYADQHSIFNSIVADILKD
jgi:pimeloyl-ACP methyl ester carboxylesterase